MWRFGEVGKKWLVECLLTACNKKAGNKITKTEEEKSSQNFDYGKIKDGVYTNDFFDFSITYDPSWHVQDDGQMAHLTELGKELFVGDDEAIKAIMKASEINSANLFAIFEHEVGAPVEFNPSLMVIAENTKFAPGIKRGKDYFFHAKKIMKQTQIDYKFEKEIYEKEMGGVSFDVMEVDADYGFGKVTQEYLTTVRKGFSISFVITYRDEEQKTKLYDLLEGVKFSR